jgi:hypothetical protein
MDKISEGVYMLSIKIDSDIFHNYVRINLNADTLGTELIENEGTVQKFGLDIVEMTGGWLEWSGD